MQSHAQATRGPNRTHRATLLQQIPVRHGAVLPYWVPTSHALRRSQVPGNILHSWLEKNVKESDRETTTMGKTMNGINAPRCKYNWVGSFFLKLSYQQKIKMFAHAAKPSRKYEDYNKESSETFGSMLTFCILLIFFSSDNGTQNRDLEKKHVFLHYFIFIPQYFLVQFSPV